MEKSVPIQFNVEKTKFAEGGFRNAFRATSTHPSYPKEWVVKKYKEDRFKRIEESLNIDIDSHARKQVQMHCVAKKLAKKLSKKAPPAFGDSFTYKRIYFSKVEETPVTVEEYIPGEFCKYVYNNGQCGTPMQETDEKAETL